MVTGKNCARVLVNPGQLLTRPEALRPCTRRRTGWFLKEEVKLGTIEPGKLGDVIILHGGNSFGAAEVSDEGIKKLEELHADRRRRTGRAGRVERWRPAHVDAPGSRARHRSWRPQLLRRQLVPSESGIFGLPGIAAAMLGPAAVLAYLICAVLVGPGRSVLRGSGEPCSDRQADSTATRPSRSVRSSAASPARCCGSRNSVVPNAAVANLLVETFVTVVPGSGALRAACFAAIYTLLAVVNIRGARSGVRLSAALAVIEIAPLVLLVAAGLFAIHPANLHWTGTPAASAIGRTAALLFFAFMGVEGALNTSGEVADPARTVPRSILLTLTLVATLYIGLQLVAQGVIGAELPGSTAPLVATATALLGRSGAHGCCSSDDGPVGGRLSLRRYAGLSAKSVCARRAPSIAGRSRRGTSALQDTSRSRGNVCRGVRARRLVGLVPPSSSSSRRRERCSCT